MSNEEVTPSRASELGDRVRRRRLGIGLTIDEAAAEGPMSPVTWSKVEAGGNVRDLTYGAVDRVLRWVEGACQDFLDHGKVPVEAKGAAHARPAIASAAGSPESVAPADEGPVKRYNLRARFAELQRQIEEEGDEAAARQLNIAFGMLEGERERGAG